MLDKEQMDNWNGNTKESSIEEVPNKIGSLHLGERGKEEEIARRRLRMGDKPLRGRPTYEMGSYNLQTTLKELKSK